MKLHPSAARSSILTARYLLLTAALILATATSHAQAPDATIQQFAKAFNAGDMATVLALHISEPSITDEIPPYHWQGPDAASRWVSDLDDDSKANHITEQSVALGSLSRIIRSPVRAYLVYPATYFFKRNGVAMSEPAQMTFVVKKEGTSWKIAAWTWTGPDPTPVK